MTTPIEVATVTGEVLPSVPRRGKQVYFAEGFYSMQADRELEQYGVSANLPPSFRLYLLGLARVNRWGHAPFGPGELQELLNVTPPTFRAARKSLIDAEMISPDSTALCLVFSGRAIRRADRSDRCCAEPKHFNRQKRMWIHGPHWGWEPREGFWHEELNNPATRQGYAAEITQSRTVRQVTEVTQTTTVRLLPAGGNHRTG